MPKTLLLADDSVTIQKVVGISFANEDFILETVDNGDDAITRAAEVKPDIVLADVVMPGKNGYEVCEAIKANPELAAVPVLLLTGTFEAFDEERAQRAGADGHITKPFEAQSLVDAVKERLAAVPPPAPVASPPVQASPAPAIASSSDGFDFLEDDQTEPSGLAGDARTTVLVEPAADVSAPASAPEEAFDFAADDPDGDLDVGGLDLDVDSDFESRPAPDLTPAAGDRTQVVLADDVDLATADTLPPADAAEPLLPAERAPEALGGLGSSGSGSGAGDATRVVFGDEALAPSGDLLGDPLSAMPEDAAVLDPTGARDYDVSSSDLGEPLQEPMGESIGRPDLEESTAPQPARLSLEAPEAPAAGATRIFELPSDPEPDLPSERVFTEPSPADRSSALDARLDLDAAGRSGEESLGAQPVAATSAPRDDDPFGPSGFTDLSDPSDRSDRPGLAEPEPVRAPASPPGLELAGPEPTVAPVSAPSTPDLGPLLRDQLHETLEKIAWEAFGEVSEAIVKQALERVEQVAWEVIPQMAEALVQEEIRRMKGEVDE